MKKLIADKKQTQDLGIIFKINLVIIEHFFVLSSAYISQRFHHQIRNYSMTNKNLMPQPFQR